MGSIKKLIQQQIPNVYVLSIEIGSSMIDDTLNGFFMNVNKQVTKSTNKEIIEEITFIFFMWTWFAPNWQTIRTCKKDTIPLASLKEDSFCTEIYILLLKTNLYRTVLHSIPYHTRTIYHTIPYHVTIYTVYHSIYLTVYRTILHNATIYCGILYARIMFTITHHYLVQ